MADRARSKKTGKVIPHDLIRSHTDAVVEWTRERRKACPDQNITIF